MSGAVTELTLRIVEEFAKDLRQKHTINQLAEACGKAYPNVHSTVQVLLEQEILKKEVVGHAHNCSLNLQNEIARLYVALVQARKKSHLKNPPETQDCDLAWLTSDGILTIGPEGDITTEEFLKDKELFATIGKHTLLEGHATYAGLLEKAGEVLR